MLTKTRKRWDAIEWRLDKGKKIVGAEIGIWKGRLSEKLLKCRSELILYMVDRWSPPNPDDSYASSGSEISQKSQKDFDQARAEALQLTAFASYRRIVLQTESKIAASMITEELDFVFIDGDHSYAGVMADLQAWWPKVKRGGWIGGHDYDHPDQGMVKQAVRDFFLPTEALELEIDDDRTWFVRKI
jgi:hypothetical protein